jgi:hypothetical protein
MKLHDKHVRLPDGRTGVVVGSGIDGLTVIADGRLVHEHASKVEVIEPPAAADPPQPQRTAQNFQTSHDPPPRVENPNRLSVLVSDKWVKI